MSFAGVRFGSVRSRVSLRWRRMSENAGSARIVRIALNRTTASSPMGHDESTGPNTAVPSRWSSGVPASTPTGPSASAVLVREASSHALSTAVSANRHRGEVHAMNVSGQRRIDGRSELIGPGTYAYEPAGNIGSWSGVGDETCIVSITVAAAMEYLDDEGNVLSSDDTDSLRDTYHRWCSQTGVSPDPRLEIKPHRVES